MTRSPDTTGNAVARLAERLSKLAGAPVALERPSDPAHGDYATNVALRTAPQRKRAREDRDGDGIPDVRVQQQQHRAQHHDRHDDARCR